MPADTVSNSLPFCQHSSKGPNPMADDEKRVTDGDAADDMPPRHDMSPGDDVSPADEMSPADDMPPGAAEARAAEEARADEESRADKESRLDDAPRSDDKPRARDSSAPSRKSDRAPGKTHRVRRWGLTILVLILIVPAMIFGAWAWVTLNYSYSKGDRAGYIQKLSQKGWLCKTWEGELAMVNLPGAMPEIFRFSVRNDSIARVLQRNIGKRVLLAYEEHRGVPTSCFAETRYYITNMRLAGE
jgi:hypothetical protein